MNPLERIVYVVARAAIAAYFDVVDERAKREMEKPNEQDRSSGSRLRHAIQLQQGRPPT